MGRAGHRNCGLLIAECGLKKRISKPEIQWGDVFCAQGPCPGHNPSILEMLMRHKRPPAEPGVQLKEIKAGGRKWA